MKNTAIISSVLMSFSASAVTFNIIEETPLFYVMNANGQGSYGFQADPLGQSTYEAMRILNGNREVLKDISLLDSRSVAAQNDGTTLGFSIAKEPKLKARPFLWGSNGSIDYFAEHTPLDNGDYDPRDISENGIVAFNYVGVGPTTAWLFELDNNKYRQVVITDSNGQPVKDSTTIVGFNAYNEAITTVQGGVYSYNIDKNTQTTLIAPSTYHATAVAPKGAVVGNKDGYSKAWKRESDGTLFDLKPANCIVLTGAPCTFYYPRHTQDSGLTVGYARNTNHAEIPLVWSSTGEIINFYSELLAQNYWFADSGFIAIDGNEITFNAINYKDPATPYNVTLRAHIEP